MKKNILLYSFILFLISCSNNDNLKPFKKYYKNRQIKTSGFEDEKGRLQGEFISFYQNGEIASIINFIDGVGTGQVIFFYENGIIKRKGTLLNDKLEGISIEYDSLGIKKYESLFSKSRALTNTQFYPNGKIKSKWSFKVFEAKPGIQNSIVYFDKKGNIKLINNDYTEISEYAIIKYGVKKKSLKVKFIGDVYNDSIVIKYKRNFKNKSSIREIIIENPKVKELIFDIRPEDYFNGRINILIETYLKNRHFAISKEFLCKEKYIQLDKDEIPAKYNIEPIW